MKINYLYILLAICTFSSCSTTEESQLEPSGIKTGYTVPQGNSDYDQDIVNFYNKFGTYLLYDFTLKDAYWTPSKWTNGYPASNDNNGKLGFLVEMPDKNYINQQLDLLKATWFDHYSDKFLDKFLPIKILLCSQVKECKYDFSTSPSKINAFNLSGYFNFDNISVSYANESITNITSAQKKVFEKDVNRLFVNCMIGQNKLVPTDAFGESANYTLAANNKTNTTLWAIGILQPYATASAVNDWKQFVTMMICYSEAYLNKTVTTVSDTDTKETSWEGIFTVKKDKNGLLKKRYTMVRQYYIDNYDIDLQTVGNTIYQ